MQEPIKKKEKIRSRDVQGLKYFKPLTGLLERLRTVGTERDKSHNRNLHMDQYCMLVLLWMYSPILTSLRGLQQASTLAKLQKKLGISRTSLGSLSESVQVFDPQPLKQIAKELGDQLPLATDMLDVPADLIAEIYRLRWLIELFLRCSNTCWAAATS